MTAEKRTALAVKRVAKLIGYGTPVEKAYSVVSMTTGLSIADVRAAWAAR